MLLIPEAKIVHIVRDGRANAYSMSKRSYRNLKLSAQAWVDGNIFGLVNQNILGSGNYMLLKYENLLTNPEKELISICDFLGLPYVAEMLDLTNNDLPEGKKYVKSFFDQSKIDGWKSQLSLNEVAQIEMIQGPLLEKMGYPLVASIEPSRYKYLSLRRRIFYNQLDNFKQLFRSKQLGMRAQELVEINLPFKNRLYSFLTILTRDFFALPIFKSLFRRYFYKEKYFKKEE
jgi:hypothetical protein